MPDIQAGTGSEMHEHEQDLASKPRAGVPEQRSNAAWAGVGQQQNVQASRWFACVDGRLLTQKQEQGKTIAIEYKWGEKRAADWSLISRLTIIYKRKAALCGIMRSKGTETSGAHQSLDVCGSVHVEL